MTRILRRIAGCTAIGGAAILAVGIVCYAANARVNTSKSIPIGLYWLTRSPVGKGDYVLFCPPKLGVFDAAKQRGYIGPGFCPGGYGYMMKRVLAAKGDTVSIHSDGVRVNGRLLPRSAPCTVDNLGRPLPRYRANPFTLGDSELLLMSDVSATSFDARYFGPLNRSQIKGVIRPILVL